MRHVADTRDTRPARGEFLVMILLGTRVLGMGPLIVLLATFQVAVGNVGIKTSIN